MRVVTADQLHHALDYPGLVKALTDLFRRGADLSERLGLEQKLADGEINTWLVMPVWQFGRHFGAKLVSIFPKNEVQHGVDSVQGLFLLFDGQTGVPLLVVDGAAITLHKTAANSAVAASFLARRDAKTMLMVGAGALAPHLIRAHLAVRKFKEILIWNRTPARAQAVIAKMKAMGISVSFVDRLEDGVRKADVISCATMTLEPLIHGGWLKPGAHLDLVGGYRPDMREADDECVRRAAGIYVDTPWTVIDICGDITQPLAKGLIERSQIVDTFQLARDDAPGRRSADDITFFKSGGGGHEDLGTVQYLLSKLDQVE